MISPKIHKAFVFDFDETIVKTKAKIKIYRNGVFYKSIDSNEYKFYRKNPKDTLDLSDFKNPELIFNAKPYKMWPLIKNISNKIKQGDDTYTIFILTGRESIIKPYIYKFLKNNGIKIELNNIITIGDNSKNVDIAVKKKFELNVIFQNYDKVYFFDDDFKNIKKAKEINGIEIKLVENMKKQIINPMLEDDMGGVSAPMSTLSSTPGMGNVTPAKIGEIGSGDNFNAINKKPYTQAIKKRKKKIMKKVNKKVNENQGLLDYNLEDAATEIWEITKSNVDRMVDQARMTGIKYRIMPDKITREGCKKLAFEPTLKDFNKLTQLVQDKIDMSIRHREIILNGNVHYMKIDKPSELDENNINPYDKIGVYMSKKMKLKLPFKRGNESDNQNSIKQQKFEHEIISLDEFMGNLNESVSSNKKGFHTNIEEDTINNEYFRKVLYTSENLQLVLMTLKPGEDIGEETHNENDQFFRFESGNGEVIINNNTYNISDGDAIIIPKGSKHNIINTGKVILQMYTIYSPPHHLDGLIVETKEDAENYSVKYDGGTSE